MDKIAIPYHKTGLEKENGVIYLDFSSHYKSISHLFFADVNKLIKKLSKDAPDSMRIARSNFKKYSLQEHVTLNRKYSPIMLGALSYGKFEFEIPAVGSSDLENGLRRIYHDIRHGYLTYDLPLRLGTNSPKPEGLLILQELGIESVPVMLRKHEVEASWLRQIKKEIGTEYPELY
jgi:hypothetical protein